MVDQGVDGICILANYSEQFLLTDEERNTLFELCLNHVAGRVPVIVTCVHFSTRVALERGLQADAAGAKMQMLMPRITGPHCGQTSMAPLSIIRKSPRPFPSGSWCRTLP